MDAAARMVAAGLGPAILPRQAVQPGHAGIVLVPLAEPWARRRFVLCTRADGSTSAATRLLAQHLQASARTASRPGANP
jgi:DNA-binding transcriptional LysR family regulator